MFEEVQKGVKGELLDGKDVSIAMEILKVFYKYLKRSLGLFCALCRENI